MQKLQRWHCPTRNMIVGDVVVLCEDGMGPARWPLAGVTKTHPGSDNVVSGHCQDWFWCIHPSCTQGYSPPTSGLLDKTIMVVLTHCYLLLIVHCYCKTCLCQSWPVGCLVCYVFIIQLTVIYVIKNYWSRAHD